MKFFKSFDEFNNWNYEQCGLKLIDVFTKTGNNFVVLDRISSGYYRNPKYFETDVNAKIYAKDKYIFEKVAIMLFDMENCITSYKHLIGCDFKHINQKGKYIKNADLGLWNIDKGFVSVQDNANYIYQLRSINLYLDDETLGTYKEYMQLHYPEYEHIWKHQL